MQFPRDTQSPLRSFTIQSVEGGAFESAVAFSELQDLVLDFCGFSGQSQVSLEEFAVSRMVTICATSLSVSGTFSEELQANFRAIDTVTLDITNRYSAQLSINSNSYNVQGAVCIFIVEKVF